MTPSSSPRHRPSEAAREAERLSSAVATALGQGVRTGRNRRRLTQDGLADLVDVDQTRISQIELGKGGGAPLSLWIAIGVALGQPLAVTFTRPMGETRQPADAGHLAIQEHLLGLARLTGRSAIVEFPTRPADPARSIDVCVRDRRHRAVIVEEAWNTFGDLGAAIRATNRKEAEAADLAATIDDGPPFRVATVWIVNATAANRALVGRFPEILASTFPGSSRAWVSSLMTGAAPPAERGLVWSDPATHRIHEWRATRRSTVGSSG